MHSSPPTQGKVQPNVTPEEYQLIQDLRQRNPAQNPPRMPLTLGQRLADLVATAVGSWRFIIIQSTLLILWLITNSTGFINHWDPYPFILLNLMLSFQAAYTAPIIMMSQNRQSIVDRQEAKHDYEVNLKAELEVELLQDKLTTLREQELAEILQLLRVQQEKLNSLEINLTSLLINRDNEH
ncbi:MULTISPECIES: DUF1003 domain-containing protein [unclassified Leptolyngbya]|uniref:DUF1003 domain-containing protein n=1 Tax=unclassified Leptolyngbya TaxID=2650499 RepID=UPI001689FF1C|nr:MULTISPECIES: DUF1003 domain-containing protein [unclassified Leptolyngbya]MBD1910468.1 DUF1003 domain-containing protein [Leptolyngbya sp. FACHB-8]MBD2153635.1 DUF1003 domain-containing protein [Leptolyngbya sp. FACHB-16]